MHSKRTALDRAEKPSMYGVTKPYDRSIMRSEMYGVRVTRSSRNQTKRKLRLKVLMHDFTNGCKEAMRIAMRIFLPHHNNHDDHVWKKRKTR